MIVCAECGFAENVGKYCLRCGYPLLQNDSGKKPGRAPVLSPSGVLVSVSLSGHSSGMMYNSDSSHSQTLEFDSERGCWTVVISEKKAFASVKTKDIYRVPAGLPEEMRNLIIESGFQEAALTIPRDARFSPQVFDYSSGYSLDVWYRESPESRKPCRFDINNERIAIAGKTDFISAVRDLFDGAAIPGALICHEEISLGINQAFFQMGQKPEASKTAVSPADNESAGPEAAPFFAADGTWTCPCGKSGLSGKFCPECGRGRPALSE